MPVTGRSISCEINGIMMSMYRNIGRGMDTTPADLAITATTGMAITVAVGTTTKAIMVGKVMTRDKAKVETEIKQDQINCY